MKLTELAPRWFSVAGAIDGDSVAYGITFLCPHCRTTRLGVAFASPIVIAPLDIALSHPHVHLVPGENCDHAHLAPAHADGLLWQREGDTFDTLTLAPSIDASASGHWHGLVTHGEVT